MTIAVLSDIHGNLEALNAVLEDLEKQNIQEIICLGDMIGYGPDPDDVVKTIMALKIPTVIGNHESVVVQPSSIQWFNPTSKKAVEVTLSMLSEKTKLFIKGLPKHILKEPCRFVHGFPPSSVRKYLFQAGDKELVYYFEHYDEIICFVGHTHFLEMISYENGNIDQKEISKKVVALDRRKKYIVNAGSVGQPRDGDNKAKYIIFDPHRFEMKVRFVSYNNEKTASKIRKTDIPDVYADRLL